MSFFRIYLKKVLVFGFVLLNMCDTKSPETKIIHDPVIIFLGNSLSEGYRLNSDESMPALIQKEIAKHKLDLKVINAGVSGDTSLDAKKRYAKIVQRYGNIDFLIIELGANDYMQGVPMIALESNIREIVKMTRVANPDVRIFLCNMKAWPASHSNRALEYNSLFRSLSESESMILIPFLLEGVVGNPELVQQDGLHPNKQGTQKMAAKVWNTIRSHVLGSELNHN